MNDQQRTSRGIIFCLLLGIQASLFAQGNQLEAYLAQGLESNHALKQKQLDVQKSLAALQEAKGLFLPKVSFQASYTLAGGGRNLSFPVGDLLNPINRTLNQLTDQQQFPTDIENVNEQFMPDNFHETRFRVVQPLFNHDIYFNYKAKQATISVAKAQRRAYAQELTKEIKLAYFNYLKAEQLIDIYRESAVLMQEVKRVNQRLLEEDKVTYDAIYQSDYDLSQVQQQQAQARQQRTQAQSYFNFLLNRPLDAPIELDSSFLQRQPILGGSPELNAEMGRRYEIEALNYTQLAQRQDFRRHRLHLLPEVNTVLDLGYQGFGYTFDSEQDYWLAQVSLSWDLFEGMQNKARIQQAKIEQDMLTSQQEALVQQIALQVRDSWHQLQAAEEGLKASRAGIQHGRQVLRITRRKYQEQQASLLELTEAQTQYTQARLQHAVNVYDYWSKRAQWEWARGR